MKISQLLLLPALILIVGCAEQRSYRVMIQNSSPDPITVGFVKLGGPFESKWAPPEHTAISSPDFNGDDTQWGTIVPPGHYTDSGVITGSFDSKALAVLRIYQGALTFNQVLARSRGDRERIDIPLDPGQSEFIVHIKNDKMEAAQIVPDAPPGH